MSRAVHFEIHASNPQALIDYYTALFGWSFNKWEGGDYWLIHTGPEEKPGINGGLLPRRGPVPEAMAAVNAFVITRWDAPDRPAAAARWWCPRWRCLESAGWDTQRTLTGTSSA